MVQARQDGAGEGAPEPRTLEVSRPAAGKRGGTAIHSSPGYGLGTFFLCKE